MGHLYKYGFIIDLYISIIFKLCLPSPQVQYFNTHKQMNWKKITQQQSHVYFLMFYMTSRTTMQTCSIHRQTSYLRTCIKICRKITSNSSAMYFKICEFSGTSRSSFQSDRSAAVTGFSIVNKDEYKVRYIRLYIRYALCIKYLLIYVIYTYL